jgi:hypothetical protein
MKRILLSCLVFLFGVQACASLVVDSSSSSAQQLAVDLPTTIRTLEADQQFSQVSFATVAARLPALDAGEALNILALSTGGSAGAFGAGAIAGLTRSGSRPDFGIVTGVSVGALVAPYAYLGPEWDARLLEAFTSDAGENLLQSRGLGAIFGSSVFQGAPLKRLVDAYVSDEMVEAVAREAERGRLLLVVTTDVATAEPVVWDLGAIARNGGAHARTLFRDVLLASASVPGMFPPVMIHVRKDGVFHDEAHVDGGATMPFFVPAQLTRTRPDASGSSHGTAVYVLIDGPLGDATRVTRLTARAVLARSIHAGLNHMLLSTLELTAANAQLQGATLQYSAIPDAYPHVEAFHFQAATMRPLLSYAYGCAQAGRLWTPFRRTEVTGTTERRTSETERVPCPAEDELIGSFASR